MQVIFNIIATIVIEGMVVIFLYLKMQAYVRKTKKDLGIREKEMNRKMYELAILKELGERIGYSLNVHQITDIIIGSLHQFIGYCVASYMLLEPEKILFNAHLEQSVSRKFIDEVRDRMLGSLSALLDKEFKKETVSEVLSGAILIEDIETPVSSFFNIPLVIGEKVVGVLTVAHTQAGLYKNEEMTILYKITQQASQAVSKLQEVVQIEQRKLNAMVESMMEGVVMTDKDYRIMVANPAIKKMLGLEASQEPTIFDLIDKLEGKFDIRGKLEESVKLDKIISVSEVLIEDCFYQIFVAPVKSALEMSKGEVLGGVVIFHDITHDKEVERMREDFTSMMVHELRSPLDNIKKLSDFLRNTPYEKTEKTHDEYLKLIFSSSADMLELVNDLLDVAKIEAGKFEIRKESADIEEIIKNRIEFFQMAAKDGNLNLSSAKSSNVPKLLEFDPVRISQVITNYLSNSLKFTDSGGKITIQTLLHQKGILLSGEASAAGFDWLLNDTNCNINGLSDSLIIAVTDNGCGISKANLAELFNKFKQFEANTKKGSSKGTGLGLSIIKGIIEAHGGSVGVASEEGVGSTFYFTLPIQSNSS